MKSKIFLSKNILNDKEIIYIVEYLLMLLAYEKGIFLSWL